MSCCQVTRARAAVFLNTLLLAMLIIPAGAQESRSAVGRGVSAVYDLAHETTMAGTVQEVLSQPKAGGLGGVHLLVAVPQGSVDAHLGAFLSKETKDSLHAGMQVQLTGSTIQLHDKEYLLVRELSIDGHAVVIRTQRGFFVQPRGSNIVTRTKATKGELQ